MSIREDKPAQICETPLRSQIYSLFSPSIDTQTLKLLPVEFQAVKMLSRIQKLTDVVRIVPVRLGPSWNDEYKNGYFRNPYNNVTTKP